MVTTFHQPQSTLLLLVSAFVKGNWRTIYDYALSHDFRFLRYGDNDSESFSEALTRYFDAVAGKPDDDNRRYTTCLLYTSMKQSAATMTFSTSGGSGDISLFSDNGKHFLVIITWHNSRYYFLISKIIS